MTALIPHAQYKIPLRTWNVEVTLLVTEKGPYNVINELCAILGVKRAQDQRDWLRERAATRPYVDQLVVKTAGGPQETWCIHQEALGYWLGYISDKKVRPSMANGLIAFQAEVRQAARDRLFGVVDGSAESKIIYLQDRFPGSPGDIVMPESDDDDSADETGE